MMKNTAGATYSLSELGRVIGVSAQAMSKYSKLAGFPGAADGGRWIALPVVFWWLKNRANVTVQRQVYSGLADALGIGGVDNFPVDQMSESDRLDLALKSHKVAKAVGDCVAFSDIRGIVGELASEIRQACGSVNAATGRDVLPFFESAFDRFEKSLSDAQSKAGEVSQ